MKTIVRKSIVFVVFQCLLLCAANGNAQNYRNPKAYISDFGRNELCVNETLAEYSAAIVNSDADIRLKSTLERIYSKLEGVNTILLKNDKGIQGDTELRDAFIKLNSKTIALLKNKSLILNDYAAQSALDYPAILRNFAVKENEMTNYYKGLIAYENSKREFALKYGINLRNTTATKNVFEYNAYQNLIFYKMNVLDDKLMALLKERNVNKVTECFNYIATVGAEGYKKTELYKSDFRDASLNNANIEFIAYMLKQKEELLTPYINYVKAAEDFQKTKAKFEKDNNSMSLESYNAEVRNYNKLKNFFFDTLYNIQLSKKKVLDSWYITNSAFLKNNTEFEDLHEKYTNLD